MKTLDGRLTRQHTVLDRVSVEPSIGVFNLFDVANFDPPGYTQSGLLNIGAGSISQPAAALQPQGTVGGWSTDVNDPVTDRINRAMLGSGMAGAGAPRAIEWGLQISF